MFNLSKSKIYFKASVILLMIVTLLFLEFQILLKQIQNGLR